MIKNLFDRKIQYLEDLGFKVKEIEGIGFMVSLCGKNSMITYDLFRNKYARFKKFKNIINALLLQNYEKERNNTICSKGFIS